MIFPKRKNLIIASALLLAALVCLFAAARIARPMQSQYQAQRWAGESGERFAQYSVFLAPGESMGTAQVWELRHKLQEKLTAASTETPAGGRSFTDCWSASGGTKIRSDRGAFDAQVLAVGGDWFAFHPFSLRSGGYLAESDLMRDRVVLDEQLAWLLFGSADVTGMTVRLGDRDFLVAGVVALDGSRAMAAVSEHKPTLYIPFDTWEALNEGLSLSEYEAVLPEPVKGFAETLLKESLPAQGGALVRNSDRFSFASSMKLLRDPGKLVVRTEAVAFPDWENAARWTELWCALLRALALALLVFPAILALIVLVRLLRLGRAKAGAAAARLKNRMLGVPDDMTDDMTDKAG